MQRLILSLAFFVCAMTVATAQSSFIPPARLGFSLGLGVDFSSSDRLIYATTFNSNGADLNGYRVDSLKFTDGSTAMSFYVGGYFGVPLTEQLHLSGRLGYYGLHGSMSGTQTIDADTTIAHDATFGQGLIEISPILEFYGLFDSLGLYPLAGLELGIPVGSSFEQSAVKSFTGGSDTRENIGATEIPNTNIRAALALGIGYAIKLTQSMWVAPEVSYRIPLTDVSADAASSPWSVGQLRLGVNVYFDISPEPTPVVPVNTFGTKIGRVTAFDPAGNEVNVEQLRVEDVRYTEMFPLVPYAFCQEGAAAPDASMQQMLVDTTRGQFAAERLPLDAIEVNKNLLNIIGSRMKATPSANLTVIGTIDGKKEAKMEALAARRAAVAKNYLVTAFGIDSNRIGVETRGLPDKPSASTDPDGVQENRRIEFRSNTPEILSPVVITAGDMRVASPDVLAFHPEFSGNIPVSSWRMNIMQAGRSLRQLEGSGAPAQITWSIKPNELSSAQVPVDYEFLTRSVNGDTAIATGSIPTDYISSVRKRTESLPDRTIEKYSLILFDFDKATLNPDNQRVLEQMVLPSIRSNSKVTIIGYTDRIGAAEYNAKLSRERAEAVKAFLKARASDATYQSNGVGESREIFTNELAVGRQLSRTVQVIIETQK